MTAPAPAPEASRAQSKPYNWRLMGALNALTGQVHYLDNYIVGRRQVIEMFQRLDQAYPQVQHISLVLDKWSIPSHPDVVEGMASTRPRLSQPVCSRIQ